MSRHEPPSSAEASACVVCAAPLSAARCTECGSAVRPGGYEVRRLIASTAHSRVYLARSPSGQDVALKELLFAQVPGAQEVEAFEREARLLETLSHPRIPQLLEHFQEGQGTSLRLYLAAEFIPGQTLLERLADRPVSEEEAREIALQVLDTLEYLHGRKPRVLHRDLKPANLIRHPEGPLFVVDFGAARESARGATSGSTLVGTFGYMPLEQLGGSVDVTSDLYALGATLVHLLGGTPPAEHFQPDTGLDLSHLEAPVLRPWLQKMTARRPADRYPSATLARQALEALQPVQPSGRLAPAVKLPPEAPAILAQLARKAEVEAQAASKSEQRQKDAALKEQEGEARKLEKKSAYREDDTLSMMDFLRMSSSRFVPLAVLPFAGLAVAVPLYLFPITTEPPIFQWPAIGTLAGSLVPFGLLFAVYALMGGPMLLRALRRRRAFRRLPFALEGLGRLLHRTDNDFNKLVRCSLRLRVKGTGTSATTLKAVQDTALQLAARQANTAITRLAVDPELAQKLRWSAGDTQAEGFANGRVAGVLMDFCTQELAAVQHEVGALHTVVIEPSEEFAFLPTHD